MSEKLEVTVVTKEGERRSVDVPKNIGETALRGIINQLLNGEGGTVLMPPRDRDV